jgi:hypothetical protein
MTALQHVLKQTVAMQTMQKVQDLLKQARADKSQEERALLLEQVRSLFRNQDGTFRGYMCRECKFGPVDHYACPSLTGSDRNRCLQCGWSATHLSAWLPWDGNLPEAAFAAPGTIKQKSATVPQRRAAPVTGAHAPLSPIPRRPVTASPSSPSTSPFQPIRVPTTKHQVATAQTIHIVHPHRPLALVSA